MTPRGVSCSQMVQLPFGLVFWVDCIRAGVVVGRVALLQVTPVTLLHWTPSHSWEACAELPLALRGALLLLKSFEVFANTQMEACTDQAPPLPLMSLSTNVLGFKLHFSVTAIKAVLLWKFVSDNSLDLLKT